MEKLREAPDKIYLQEYVGSNGIHCLDYQNYDDDIEYTRSDIIPKHETVEELTDFEEAVNAWRFLYYNNLFTDKEKNNISKKINKKYGKPETTNG